VGPGAPEWIRFGGDLLVAGGRIGFMFRYASRMGVTPGRVVGVTVFAMLIVFVWLAADRESGQGLARRCLPAADASPAASTTPAVIALLGDGVVRSRAFEGPQGPHVNRLLRISLPGGEVQRERALGRRLPDRAIDKRDSFRLDVAAAPLLATAPGDKAVVVLVKEPAPSRDRVAVIDAASFKTRCSYLLERGVRYSGLLLGRSGRLYAFGKKRAGGSRRWDAVLTIVDVETGAVAASETMREAERGKWRGWGTDWFVYGGALSADERRLILSYHGRDTTGADQFLISPGSRVSASGRAERRCLGRGPRWPCGPGRVDIPLVHGAVAAVETEFVGAAAEDGLLRLDRRARVVERMPVPPDDHLMDFALDGARSLLYVSSCGRRPAIQRLDLARNRQQTLPSGRVCGQPLAVHRDRFLVLAATRVDKHGYPAGRPRLRLIDLEDPDSGARVPRSGAPLDALVVPSPG
jgi:hypothetical protein